MMNDAGGPYSLGLTGDQQHLFWAQFSAWMAASTVGNFAFWFTGGTTDAFFPSPCVNYPTRCFFEEYELPNLQQVSFPLCPMVTIHEYLLSHLQSIICYQTFKAVSNSCCVTSYLGYLWLGSANFDAHHR